ncbi:MAG: PspC domain-containing protein [Capnocytophaga sp.]|nr:PspC domain-containing protein [Capnocytophaga sp.]
MDKTHNISLGGFAFLIEDRAYQQLSKYLNDVRKSLGKTADTEEIIYDVEQRMAELLKNQMKGREVIVSQDVTYLIDVLGTPEQYLDEDASHDYNFSEADKSTENQNFADTPKGKFDKTADFFRHKKLFRDLENKQLAGVFAGLSHYLIVEATWLRVGFLSGYLFIFVLPKLHYLFPLYAMIWMVAYILLASIIPAARTTADKLAMRGKEVNIDTLASAKESYDTNKFRLRLNKQKGKFLGVFAGISEYFGWDVTWLRIGYVLVLLLCLPFEHFAFFASWIVLYLIFWLSMNKPKNDFFQNDEQTENGEQTENFTANFSTERNSFSFWAILRGFFKGIFYFLTAIVLSILLVICVGLLLALFGVNIFFLGSVGGTLLVYDYLPFLIEMRWELVLLYISLGILSFVALFVPIMLLINLFSPKKSTFSKKWIVVNVVLFFIGIIGLSVVAGNTVRSFGAYTSEIQRHKLENTDSTLVVQNTDNQYVFSNFIDADGGMFMTHNEGVEIYVTSKQPYLEVVKTARGNNIQKAKSNIHKTLYPLEVKNDTILLPNHYKIEKGGLYRGQEVDIRLYLPENKKIKFDNFNQYTIRVNKKRVRITGDEATYIVTKEGLKKLISNEPFN